MHWHIAKKISSKVQKAVAATGKDEAKGGLKEGTKERL